MALQTVAVDPWLTRKSPTCPLCKHNCLPPPPEQGSQDGEGSRNAPPPNDRLIEFIMGPEWIASRTRNGHTDASPVSRIGNFFRSIPSRLRGRSGQVNPSTVSSASDVPPPSPPLVGTNGVPVVVQESPQGENTLEPSVVSISEEVVPRHETVVNIPPSSEPSNPGK